MMKKSAKQHTLKEILDSDDEIPTEYIDLPFVPAYQMENRFDHIEDKKDHIELNIQRKEQFDHIEDKKVNEELKIQGKDQLFVHIEDKKVDIEIKIQGNKQFDHIEHKKIDIELKIQGKEHSYPKESSIGRTVVYGYLNKKDTFCFRCLKPNTGKKTQQWFLYFLMIKDLHASYKFLNTCLVPRYCGDYSGVL